MKIHYSITKEQRKKLVEVIGTALGTTASYCGAPSFSYKVGAFEIRRDGCLCFADDADEAEVERVRTALREAGFAEEADAPEMPPTATETATEAESEAETEAEEEEEEE